MQQYERGGVVIDQCGECRGVFLDRGELEHLVDAEAQWSGGRAQARSPRPVQPQYEDHRYEQQHSHDDHRYEQHSYDDRHRHKKKRKSFFEELFDD
jgi:hypothetical protein